MTGRRAGQREGNGEMNKTAIVTMIGSAVGWAMACGASETGPGSQVYGGNGGGAGVSAGGSGGDGGNAGVGVGGNSASGGNGGSIIIGGNGGQSGSGMLGDGAVCEGFSQGATNKVQPADIVVVVDNSGSMAAEAGFVQQNLNGFSNQITMSGVDVQVVLISSYPGRGHGVCVDPPLGSGGCPSMDSRAPTFLHVNQQVDSENGLELIISTYQQWRGSMRQGASKHFIVITDDNSDLPANDFNTQLLALDAPLFQGYKMHAVFAPTADPLTCLLNPASDPCCTPGMAAAAGTVYQQLVMMTGAVAGNLCLQGPGFTQVFNAVATKVVQGSGIACEWDIPQQQDGGMFDPNKVNVKFTNGMQQRDLGRVGSQSECSNFKDAWYYDNPAAPTKVFACPDICTEMKGGSDVKIEVQFGCPVKPPIPV
jgi:hypothetical protein